MGRLPYKGSVKGFLFIIVIIYMHKSEIIAGSIVKNNPRKVGYLINLY